MCIKLVNYQDYVELYSKNKFEKLVHLVGFIIRISHDARSPERQICIVKCMSLIRDGYLASDIKKKTFIILTRKPTTKPLLRRARKWVENMQIESSGNTDID